MGHPNNKVPQYIEERLAGLKPLDAALAAGYAQSAIRVTASRLETRADVKSALRKGKRMGRRDLEDNEVGGDVLRSPLAAWTLKKHYSDPLSLLLDVMNNPEAPGGLRIQCAKDAMPYCHARKETSKREDGKTKAKETAKKYPTMPVPLRRAA